MPNEKHVVIVGGGFAGLETAFLLRHRLHEKVRLSIVSDTDHFLFRPNTIYIPFGTDPDKLKIDLHKPAKRQHINFVNGRVTGIDAGEKRFVLENGHHVSYDLAVIATGAAMRPGDVPGLTEHANTIWTPDAMLALRHRFEWILERSRAGNTTRVQFLIPPNNKCAGPLYEIVFMLDTWLRRRHARGPVELTWSTSEFSYLQAFGPKLHDIVAEEFSERHIHGEVGRTVREITANQVHFTEGHSHDYDVLIAFPPYVAAVTFDGLPADDRGFLHTEFATRQVSGFPDIYAPGDAGDFPVKQAFLAFLQADATAEHIASRLDYSGTPRAVFDPISMCVMEQLDKAVFAQVPLETTGDPLRPVRVREDAPDLYKTGVSPMWRMGKKMLGVYLPMRFTAGEPFHAGTAWQMMDMGLHAMSAIFAE